MTDIAIRLRAENAGWSFQRIAEEAARHADAQADEIERCFRTRNPPEVPAAQDEAAPGVRAVGAFGAR